MGVGSLATKAGNSHLRSPLSKTPARFSFVPIVVALGLFLVGSAAAQRAGDDVAADVRARDVDVNAVSNRLRALSAELTEACAWAAQPTSAQGDAGSYGVSCNTTRFASLASRAAAATVVRLQGNNDASLRNAFATAASEWASGRLAVIDTTGTTLTLTMPVALPSGVSVVVAGSGVVACEYAGDAASDRAPFLSFASDSVVAFLDVSFANCSLSFRGSALAALEGVHVTGGRWAGVDDVTRVPTLSEGGCVSVSNAAVYARASSFANCVGGTGGTAIVSGGGLFYAVASAFLGSRSSGEGGAFALTDSGALRVSSCVVSDVASSGGEGGGFAHLRNDAVFSMDRGTLLSNATAYNSGGGLAVAAGTSAVVVDACDITSCSSFRRIYGAVLPHYYGGCFRVTSNSFLALSNTTLTTARSESGGVAYVDGFGKVAVSNCSFFNVSAYANFEGEGYGGLLHATDFANVTITGTTIAHGYASSSGGVISAVYGSNLVVYDLRVDDSRAHYAGGFLYLSGSATGYLQRLHVTRASAWLFGGAITATTEMTLVDAVFEDVAGPNGGVAMVSGGVFLLRNVAVRRASAESGGVFYIDSGSRITVEGLVVEGATAVRASIAHLLDDGTVLTMTGLRAVDARSPATACFMLSGADLMLDLTDGYFRNVTAVVFCAIGVSYAFAWDIVVHDASPPDAVSLFETYGGLLDVRNAEVARVRAGSYSSLFSCSKDALMRVYDVTVSDIVLTDAAALWSTEYSTLFTRRLSVSNVTMTDYGGAVFWSGRSSFLKATGVLVRDVQVARLGGGIGVAADTSELVVLRMDAANTAALGGNGGALLATDNATLLVSDSVFENTRARGCGGFVAVEGTARVTVQNVSASKVFSDGVVFGGGAVCVVRGARVYAAALPATYNPPVVTMVDVKVVDATALLDGGCVALQARTALTIANASFTNCRIAGEPSTYASGGFLYAGPLSDTDLWDLRNVRVSGSWALLGAVVFSMHAVPAAVRARAFAAPSVGDPPNGAMLKSGEWFAAPVFNLSLSIGRIACEPGMTIPAFKATSHDAYGQETFIPPLRSLSLKIAPADPRAPISLIGSVEAASSNVFEFHDVTAYGTPGTYDLRILPNNFLYNASIDTALFATHIPLTLEECAAGRVLVSDGGRLACRQPFCVPSCQHGECVSFNGTLFVCKCSFGWLGKSCDVPVLYTCIAVGLAVLVFVLVLSFVKYRGLLASYLRKGYEDWRTRKNRSTLVLIVKQLSSKINDAVGIVTDLYSFLEILARPTETQYGVVGVYTAFFVIGTFLVALSVVASAWRIRYTLAIAKDPSYADEKRLLRRKLFVTSTSLLVVFLKNIPMIGLSVYITKMDSRRCIAVNGAFMLSFGWSAFSIGTKMSLFGKIIRHVAAYLTLLNEAKKDASRDDGSSKRRRRSFLSRLYDRLPWRRRALRHESVASEVGLVMVRNELLEAASSSLSRATGGDASLFDGVAAGLDRSTAGLMLRDVMVAEDVSETTS